MLDFHVSTLQKSKGIEKGIEARVVTRRRNEAGRKKEGRGGSLHSILLFSLPFPLLSRNWYCTVLRAVALIGRINSRDGRGERGSFSTGGWKTTSSRLRNGGGRGGVSVWTKSWFVSARWVGNEGEQKTLRERTKACHRRAKLMKRIANFARRRGRE